MLKPNAFPKPSEADARYAAQLGDVLRQIDQRLKWMKKLGAEIERLCLRSRASLGSIESVRTKNES